MTAQTERPLKDWDDDQLNAEHARLIKGDASHPQIALIEEEWRQRVNVETQHVHDEHSCSCGSDTCLCQRCAKVVCGSTATWVENVGNVCSECAKDEWKVGLTFELAYVEYRPKNDEIFDVVNQVAAFAAKVSPRPVFTYALDTDVDNLFLFTDREITDEQAEQLRKEDEE